MPAPEGRARVDSLVVHLEFPELLAPSIARPGDFVHVDPRRGVVDTRAMRTTDRFGMIFDAALLVLCLGVLGPGCSRETSTTAAPAPAPASASAVAETSAASGPAKDPALEHLAKAGYVGNTACADCHADIAEAFSRSAMARSLRPAGAWPPGTTSDPRLGLEYSVRPSPDGRGVVQHEARMGARGKVVAEDERVGTLAMGSVHAVSFMAIRPEPGLAKLDELPMTYYTKRPGWDLSPGYRDANRRFVRPLGEECLFCHNMTPWIPAASVDPAAKDAHGFLGIGCERCHGPGASHVAKHGAADTIFNPGKAAPEVVGALCDQCHLHGRARVFAAEWDGSPPHPAKPLEEVLSIFVEAEPPTGTPAEIAAPIAGQADRLRLSKCAESSGDRLRCTTCHDPHRSAAELPGGRNAGCAKCHTPDACDRPAHGVDAKASAAADCTACHLAQVATTDVPHASATDHWIRRRIPAPAKPLKSGEETVERADPERALKAAHGGRGIDAAEANARLASAELRIADAARHQPLLLQARARFESVLRDDPENTLAHAGLGQIASLMHEWPAAVGHLSQATRAAPGLEQSWRQLARAHANSNDYPAAREAFEAARRVALDPAEVAFEAALAALKQGAVEEAVALIDEATKLRPELPDIRREAAVYRLQLKEPNAALEGFKEVCRRTLCTPEYATQIALVLETSGFPELAMQFLDSARVHGTPAEGLRPAVLQIAQKHELTDELLRWFGTEFDTDPTDLEAATRFADLLFKVGQANKSVEVYESVLKRAGPSEVLLRKLGVAQGVNGKLPLAEATLRRAIEVSKTRGETETWNNLGLALNGQNKKAEAIEAFRNATKRSPKFAFAWFNMAMAYEELKKPKEGLAAVLRGLEAAPDDVQAQLMRRRLTIAVFGTKLSPAELERRAPLPASGPPSSNP